MLPAGQCFLKLQLMRLSFDTTYLLIFRLAGPVHAGSMLPAGVSLLKPRGILTCDPVIVKRKPYPP